MAKLISRAKSSGGASVLTAALVALSAMTTSGANAQDKPKRGGMAIIGVGVAATTLNTQLTSAVTPLILADLWASGLFKYDRDGNKKPQIASSWEVSSDGKAITFNLRPNLLWSDGKPFSADDVKFTFDEFAKFNTYLVKLLPVITRTEAPNATTFVVHLKEPYSTVLEAFDKEIFPLMPKHIYAGTDIPTNPANRSPVGLGPYKVVKWEEGRGITFQRNEHYWDKPKPYLDSVVAMFIPDASQQMNALYRGEVDSVRTPLPHVGRSLEQAKSGRFSLHEVKVSAPERLSVDINTRREALSKPEVRRAILTAIDRQRLVKDVYQGYAIPAGNAIPEQFTKLTDPSIDYNKMYAYDPKKAAAMLDEAGYPVKDGKRFSIEITGPLSADSFFSEPAAQIIAANLRAVGIEVRLGLMEPQLWINKVFRENNYDISLVSLTGRTDPLFGVDRSFLCNTQQVPYVNPTGYCNPELDEVAGRGAAVPLEQRKDWYKRYAEIVARDLPHLSLTNNKKFQAVSNRFGGIEAEMDLSYNGNPNYSEVWIK